MLPEMTIEMTTTAAMDAADVPEELEAYNMYITLTDENKKKIEQLIEKLRGEQGIAGN